MYRCLYASNQLGNKEAGILNGYAVHPRPVGYRPLLCESRGMAAHPGEVSHEPASQIDEVHSRVPQHPDAGKFLSVAPH